LCLSFEGQAEAVRLNFRPYKYILAIMGDADVNVSKDDFSDEENWQIAFTKEVQFGNIVLTDGKVNFYEDSINLQICQIHTENERVLGKYRFISSEDVSKKFSSELAWVRITQNPSDPANCPYVGNLVGYINFEFLDNLEEEDEEFKEECIRAFTYPTHDHRLLQYGDRISNRISLDLQYNLLDCGLQL
jgi:hypothetical protein